MSFSYCDIDKDCPFKRILTSADPLDYSKIKILCVGNKKYCKEAKEKEQRTSFAKNKEKGISYSQLEKALDKACEMIGKQICEEDNVLDCPKERPEKCDLKCKECWKEYLLKDGGNNDKNAKVGL